MQCVYAILGYVFTHTVIYVIHSHRFVFENEAIYMYVYVCFDTCHLKAKTTLLVVLLHSLHACIHEHNILYNNS